MDKSLTPRELFEKLKNLDGARVRNVSFDPKLKRLTVVLYTLRILNA